MKTWQRIDIAPVDTWVLGYMVHSGHGYFQVVRYTHDAGWDAGNAGLVKPPYRWMPLPVPPESED